MNGPRRYPGVAAAEGRLRAIHARARTPAASAAEAERQADVRLLLAVVDAVLRGHALRPDGWCGICLPARPAVASAPAGPQPAYGCVTRVLVVETLLRQMAGGWPSLEDG